MNTDTDRNTKADSYANTDSKSYANTDSYAGSAASRPERSDSNGSLI